MALIKRKFNITLAANSGWLWLAQTGINPEAALAINAMNLWWHGLRKSARSTGARPKTAGWTWFFGDRPPTHAGQHGKRKAIRPWSGCKVAYSTSPILAVTL
jgi:hypothetical protein